ncbi:MAG: DNA repair protein RadC [Burkholderiales bacterium]|nr:DNA repair protein RadC [Burkholderiales bacterium]
MTGIVRDSHERYSSTDYLSDAELIDAAIAAVERRWKQHGESINGTSMAADLFKLRLSAYPYEVFAALFLDTRHRMIAFEELFRGTIDGCSVHPREIVRRCILLNAAALIIGHVHPSGVPDPSAADRAITHRIKDALALIDVRLLDHIVVGAGAPVSFALRGLL